MNGYIAIGTFTEDTIAYLREMTAAAPIDLYRDPFVFASPATQPFTREEADAALAQLGNGCLPFVYVQSLNVYSPGSMMTERAIVSQPTALAPTFNPYYVMALDPARSQRARFWLTSIADTMAHRRKPMYYTVRFEPVDSPFGLAFNPEVQNEFTKPSGV